MEEVRCFITVLVLRLFFLQMSKLVLLQDIIPALHQCLGMSAGAEFSSEDISLLFCKVFHVPSNRSEADAAMKKVTILAFNNKLWAAAVYSFIPTEYYKLGAEKLKSSLKIIQVFYYIADNEERI